ncbi:hypothetical protein RND59_01860 [Vibrio ruber]|uniref:hypothetical protein n=1 Tax=Vibrio ruber TaxID=184755 RepID=UPI0028932CE0|nr:hypothetical protein [Vibrio ruber]WNJ95889.1 hypothetical protein RND59_01860 [Vibrio ruber]
MKKQVKRAVAFVVTALWGASVSAATGCYPEYTDGSQWFEKTITFNPAMTINYDSSSWGSIRHVVFKFESSEIENPRDFTLNVQLASAVTKKQYLWGVLPNSSSNNGGILFPGSSSVRMNMTRSMYLNALTDGEIELGLGRTLSGETLRITQITAKFCGVLPAPESVEVDVNRNNIGAGQGSAQVHFVDPNTTYRVEVAGSASDKEGNEIPTVGMSYVDPRKHQHITVHVAAGSEAFLNTDGQVSLFYSTSTTENTGGHQVNFSRVNLD